MHFIALFKLSGVKIIDKPKLHIEVICLNTPALPTAHDNRGSETINSWTSIIELRTLFY